MEDAFEAGAFDGQEISQSAAFAKSIRHVTEDGDGTPGIKAAECELRTASSSQNVMTIQDPARQSGSLRSSSLRSWNLSRLVLVLKYTVISTAFPKCSKEVSKECPTIVT